MTHLTLLIFLFLLAFLEWQVVTGMEAEKDIESLANYIWFFKNTKCCLHFTSAFDFDLYIDIIKFA